MEDDKFKAPERPAHQRITEEELKQIRNTLTEEQRKQARIIGDQIVKIEGLKNEAVKKGEKSIILEFNICTETAQHFERVHTVIYDQNIKKYN